MRHRTALPALLRLLCAQRCSHPSLRPQKPRPCEWDSFQGLEHRGNPLTAADALRNECEIGLLSPEKARGFSRDACAARTKRMTKRNSPAVYIYFCLIQAEFPHDGNALRRKGLV